MHTGRHRLDEVQPSLGAWVHYGLGTLNDNLPQFVVLGGPTRPDTRVDYRLDYLGPSTPACRWPSARTIRSPTAPRPGVLAEEQKHEYDLIGQLNRLAGGRVSRGRRRCGRGIRRTNWRSACRRPCRRRSTCGRDGETQKLYGLDDNTPRSRPASAAGRAAARRARRAVRAGLSDALRRLGLAPEAEERSTPAVRQVDKPIAGLLKDLKRRGLLDDVTSSSSAPSSAARRGWRRGPAPGRRPRPPPARLHDLAGRRAASRGLRPRRDRRAGLPRRRAGPLRDRPARHRAAPAGARPAPAGGAGAQAAGNRPRPADPRDPGVRQESPDWTLATDEHR